MLNHNELAYCEARFSNSDHKAGQSVSNADGWMIGEALSWLWENCKVMTTPSGSPYFAGAK